MENSNIQAFVITTDMATLVREGAAKERSAFGAKRKAAEAIAAAGGRGHMFTKDGVKAGQISKETLAGLQGMIAAGLLTKPEFTLWAMGSKEAAKVGKQEERNRLTSNVSTYLAGFRGMIETAWRELNPDLAKIEQDEAKGEGEGEGEGEGAPITGADLRKRLLDLITDVAASDAPNRDDILESLNSAESLMAEW